MDPAERTGEPVLTISAAYGAGGSVIAPRLAAHFGLPLVDRLLTVDVTEAAGQGDDDAAVSPRSAEGLSAPERAASPASRLFTHLARAASVGTVTGPPLDVDVDDIDLRRRAERDLAPLKEGAGGVVLGRAGAVVLAKRPRAYHVRLDGPVARRVAQAATIEGISPAEAADHQAKADRARLLWVKRLYRADAADPAWYHLWVDSTALGLDATFAVVAAAFEAFRAGAA